MRETDTDAPLLRLCRRRRSVRDGSREVRLPDLSFRLIDLLASRAPADVTYAEIESAVWQAQVTRETIKQRVKLLRDGLAPLGVPEHAIEAVRNIGYRTTLSIGLVETPERRDDRSFILAAVAAALALMAAVAVHLLARPTGTALVPTLLVESLAPPADVDPAGWEGARRSLVRDLSKIDGVRVLDRPTPGKPPSLLARLALDRDGNDLRLSTELLDGPSSAVLFAESYRYDPASVDRSLTHFASNAYAVITALSLQLGDEGMPVQPDAVRSDYARAFGLWRRGDRQALIAARSILERLLAERGALPVVQSLLVRVKADLVLGHVGDAALAREARQEAERLVAAHPDIGEFHYSLARALLALGRREAALDELRIAQRTMPFLSRDVAAIERAAP
ncbi:DNA-binding winged helix-turn-helix (wHTH) protein [Sphingomonas leidyi]|uniref:DNA-binding winged helix-turn-helix (WHTH) protein n=1 Tax=Sphingomonas leidyi TaxID=68569 RepID=A0A7X5UZ89_9SPHN|nr:winged helix-turn-helix domain-containing protein [Sphingomonas leidyi]NIJ65004.1 DNA-binding winged helix-turn-helix (wHTH) protein [Sphingomonas leidyi]